MKPFPAPPEAAPGADHVLPNFRYLSVYNELVARISQRQQSLALFVAIFTGLVTALILTRDVFRSDPLSIAWIMVGFPFASLVLTFLNYKYETLISLLRQYLAELERVGGAQLRLPSYNCDAGYMGKANQARYFHDLACATLIVAYNAAAVGIYCAVSGTLGIAQWAVAGAVAAVSAGCFLAHLRMPAHYYRPSA